MYRFFSFGLFLFLLIGNISPVSVFAATEITPTPTIISKDNCTSGVFEAVPTAGEGMGTCTYTLLEPIGDTYFIDVGATGGIGSFMNTLFSIIIGIAGVIGIVMLVIYGFQYAANEQSISNFTALREKIQNVILGLLLLLGTFIILRTINPDLLLIDPEIGGVGLSNYESGDGFEPTYQDSPVVGVKTKACSEGIVSVQGISVCKRIADNFGKMISAAKAAGVPIGGYGARSPQRQIELRNENCKCNNNTDCIYKKPVRQCVPWTARPGTSRHESGLAVDFTCNGGTMRAGSSCFVWMRQNAAKYGFYNLPSESWHWSIDGR